MALFGLVNYGTSSSTPTVVDPYGGMSAASYGRYQRNFARPAGQAFGFGFDPNSRFGQQLSSRAQAGNPFAQYLQNTQGLIAPLQTDAARAGQEIATRAPGAFQGYMAQASDYLNNLLPQLQGQLGEARGAANLGGAQYGVDQARNFLQQAGSPVQSNALYQNALRQATQASQAGAAGRGLLDAGSTQGQQDTIARDLAAQYAQSQFANQQTALGGYGGALGTQQNAGSLLGQLTNLGGQLGQSGIGVSQDMLQALPYYAQLLQSGSQLPFQTAQMLQNFFAATQNPNFQLGQATAPQIGQRQSSFQI